MELDGIGILVEFLIYLFIFRLLFVLASMKI